MKRIILTVGSFLMVAIATAQTSETTKQTQYKKGEDKTAKAVPEENVKSTSETPKSNKKLIYIKNSDLKPLRQKKNMQSMPAENRKSNTGNLKN